LVAAAEAHATAVVGALAVVVVGFAAGCTSERIVYRSGANFPAPVAAAGNFIGAKFEADGHTIGRGN